MPPDDGRETTAAGPSASGDRRGATDVDRAAGLQVLDRDATAPSILHARGTRAVVSLLERPGLPPEAALHPTGLVIDTWVPAGRTRLTLRALGGGRLDGEPEPALELEPVTPLGEGLGPELLLAPGQSRFFGFTLARNTRIGVGVQALAGQVACTLRGAHGERLGDGIVQMRELEPGDYLIELAAPADGRVVRARPALAGLVAPSTGPPEDVMRGYFVAAGVPVPGDGGYGRIVAPPAPSALRRVGPREEGEPGAPGEGDEGGYGDETEPAGSEEGEPSETEEGD